jgi:hypothetical protein
MNEIEEVKDSENFLPDGEGAVEKSAATRRALKTAAAVANPPDRFPDADASGILAPEQASGLTYRGEDELYYFVTDRDGARLRLPKNRSAVDISDQTPSSEFTPVFRVLLLGLIGLAPSGLGTIILAPLAMAWSAGLALRRPLSAAGRVRMAVVWLIAAGLLAIAIPMSFHFLSRVFGAPP